MKNLLSKSAGISLASLALLSVLWGCAAPLSNPPPINAPPADLPVYNAVFSPTFPNRPAVLVDAEPSSVRFFIGPRDQASAVDSKNWTVDPEVLASEDDVPLIVTMVCRFCTDLHTQNHPITYFAAKRSSTQAKFDFVPLRSKLDDPAGVGRVAFEITKNGVQTDYVVANVRVVPAGTKRVETFGIERPMASGPARLTQPDWSQDVDLVIAVRPDGNRLQVQLIPGSEGVAKLFGRKHVTPDGEFHSFNTGMLKDDVKRVNGELYAELYATINKNDRLKSLLGVPGPTNDILLSRQDKGILLKPFFDAGVDLYRQLFVTGADPDLGDLMEKFRTYARADTAIRVRIQSQGVYLPWQILIPSSGSDPKDFWGFKYELSINPTGIDLSGAYAGPLKYESGPLIFGEFRSADTKDTKKTKNTKNTKNTENTEDLVTTLAKNEAAYLQSDMKIAGILVKDSRDSFLNQLQQSRTSVQMIVTFTHGLSGSIIKDNGEVTESILGPQLQFADNEFLRAGDLNKLPSTLKLPPTEISVFGNAPLVFLNGCETGTAGFYPTTNLDFAGTFLRLGARGVIVTEAPVWTYFGYNFGISLLKQMKTGGTIPHAILAVRKENLDEANNPLGLLYTYYGGPDVTVNFQ